MTARTKLTPELQERVVAMLRTGVPVVEACQAVGIDRATFNRWLKRGDGPRGGEYTAFAAATRQARAECEATLAEAVSRSSKTSWRAAAWLLERQFPERWSATRQAEAPKAATTDPMAEFDELARRRSGNLKTAKRTG